MWGRGVEVEPSVGRVAVVASKFRGSHDRICTT